MSRDLVLDAVKHRKTSSRTGVLQRLFAHWFNALVYNQIWEDPRVDVEALEIGPESRILTISSGGCNALNYLLAEPASVTAVDLNRHQVFLLELKVEAIRRLPKYEDLFDFFGRGRGPNTGANYVRHIRPHLSRETRDYWESNSLAGSLLYGSRIAFFADGGLYDHSRNGYFLRFFHWLAHLHGYRPEAVLEARSAEEQRDLFVRHIESFFATPLIKFVGRLPLTAFGLGIPPQQYAELLDDLAAGNTIIDLYRDRVRRLACDFPISENYFAWQAFARKYDCESRCAVPDYLKEENFDLIRSRIGRISVKNTSVADAIVSGGAGAYDRFVFLDAQDWMNNEQLVRLWTALAENAARRSRIIFRTAGSRSPLERSLPPDLLGRFKYEAARSRELFQKDRSSIYGGFHLYVLQ